MTCCSTCFSGFAAVVALLAFIFDLAFFFLAKAHINEVGSAEIGNAIWLTLAAWVLLFFSGCFYTHAFPSGKPAVKGITRTVRWLQSAEDMMTGGGWMPSRLKQTGSECIPSALLRGC